MNSSVINKFRAKSIESFLPLQASLELTHRCNERCTHCYIDDFSDDAQRLLDENGWNKVLEELRQAGTLYIILMGGEPLLSPHFFHVCRQAASMGFHVSMISNGLQIRSLQDARRLKESGLHAATFSFYSLNPAIHDAMTSVKGSQQRTERAIELCLEAGVEAHVNCLLTNANIFGVFDLEDWCMARKIQLKADPMVTAKLNGQMSPTKMRMSESQIEWFYRTRSQRWSRSLPVPTVIEPEGYVCNAAKGKCAVTPYGDLLPCIEIRESMGNLVTSNFQEIWRTPSAEKWRFMKNSDVQQNPEFAFCDHCPGMAKNETGDARQVLSYAKLLSQVKQRVYRSFKDDEASREHGLPAT